MLPQQPPIFTGVNPPTSPDYTDPNVIDKSQEISNTRVRQGNPQNPGAVLTTDTLNVPLEVLMGINNERINTSRPTLLPLFRTRYVEGEATEISGLNDYQELRSQLSPALRQQLEADEKLEFDDRDTQFIAFDNSLRFEAMRRAFIRHLGGAVVDVERAEAGAVNNLAMPDEVRRNTLNFGNEVLTYLDQYLKDTGANEPEYDLLLNAAIQLREAIVLLNMHHEG